MSENNGCDTTYLQVAQLKVNKTKNQTSTY